MTSDRKDRTMSDKDKAPKPMDANYREDAVGTQATNHPRVCYTLKTLTAEVLRLFPETVAVFNDFNGRNTALSVMFDTFDVDESDRETFVSLLRLVEGDHRVQDVIVEDYKIMVTAIASPRTQDSRESFELTAAYRILLGLDEPDQDEDGFLDAIGMDVEGSL